MTDTTKSTSLVIDPNQLTLAELEEIEDLTGQSSGVLFGNKENMSVKTIRALVYIVKRRDDPTFTYEDAGSLAIGELEVDVAPDPTAAAG